MPRGPRLVRTGVLQHVMARGIERRKLFLDNHDRIRDQANLIDLFGRLPSLNALQCFSTIRFVAIPLSTNSIRLCDPLLNASISVLPCQ